MLKFVLTVICSTLAGVAQGQTCIPRWDTMSGGVSGVVDVNHTHAYIASMVRLSNGDIVVAGAFTHAGGTPANNIARWDGTAWHPLGDGTNANIGSIHLLSTGEIVAYGGFTSAGGVACRNLALWDGSQWHSLISRIEGGTVRDAAVLNGDTIVVFGDFNRLDGVDMMNAARLVNGSWQQISGPSIRWRSCGLFQSFGEAAIAWGDYDFWNSSGQQERTGACILYVNTWAPIPNVAPNVAPNLSVYAAIPDEANQWLVGGQSLSGLGPLARMSLVPYQSESLFRTSTDPLVQTMARLLNGDVIIGGRFPDINNLTLNNLARWDGVTLHAVGSGTNRNVLSSLVLPNGQVIVAGQFTSIEGQPCGGIAKAWILRDTEVVRQPSDQAVSAGSSVTFSLQAIQLGQCQTPLSFRWQRRDPRIEDPNASNAWIDLTDDGTFANTSLPTFSILNPTAALATGYRCRIMDCACSNPIYSDEVNFSIACPADFNADGGVDFTDVEAFFERWENGC